MFKILIKPPGGYTKCIEVHPSTTIKELKNKIEDRTKIPYNTQQLIWKGRHLQDSQTIEECGIHQNSSTIYLHTKKVNTLFVEPDVPTPDNKKPNNKKSNNKKSNNNTKCTIC